MLVSGISALNCGSASSRKSFGSFQYPGNDAFSKEMKALKPILEKESEGIHLVLESELDRGDAYIVATAQTSSRDMVLKKSKMILEYAASESIDSKASSEKVEQIIADTARRAIERFKKSTAAHVLEKEEVFQGADIFSSSIKFMMKLAGKH